MGRYLIFKTTILKYGIQILRLDFSKIKKRCTVSDSISKNEKNIARKIRIFRMFLTVFPFLMPNSESLPSLLAHSFFFKKGQLERIAPAAPTAFTAPTALYKRATVSDSLRLLMTKERRERIALLSTINERIMMKLVLGLGQTHKKCSPQRRLF